MKTMKTILIVDDNQELLRCLSDVLVYLGYTVIPAQNAGDALAVIKGGASVDLVITDYHMPEMHGLDLVVCLKQAAPAVPAILCSAFAERDLTQKARNLGVAAYVDKPYKVQELKQIIEEVLKQSI